MVSLNMGTKESQIRIFGTSNQKLIIQQYPPPPLSLLTFSPPPSLISSLLVFYDLTSSLQHSRFLLQLQSINQGLGVFGQS